MCKIEALCKIASGVCSVALNQPREVGWGGRLEGRYVYLWLMHVEVDRKRIL